MKKNYILSIDGNYQSDFDASFYIGLMTKYYQDKGFDCKNYTINSSLSMEENLSTLDDISKRTKNENTLSFIIGSLAEPIINDLSQNNQVQGTFNKFEEITRVYRCLSQVIPSINILLIKKSENNPLTEGFQKIDSMNISMGFDFDLLCVDNEKMMNTYKQILEIIRKKGWETPPFID